LGSERRLSPAAKAGILWTATSERIRSFPCVVLAVAVALLVFVSGVDAQQKPNIVVIWGDDIGYWNVGAYTHGLMGWTPNIDSIAKNGMLFTDNYGQPSCTAGRAAFIMGQLPVRTASPVNKSKS
jgi:hypothetical protein